MPRPVLTILCGIPGCGKSTWASRMGLPVVSSDSIRLQLTGSETNQDHNEQVFNLFHSHIDDFLSHGLSIAADSTALTRSARAELQLAARVKNAETHLVLFKNVDQALYRNRRRDRVVPDEAMQRMVARYEQTVRDVIREGYDHITVIESVK